jgi:hypothetical protein
MITAHFPIGYEFENDEVEKIVRVGNSIPVYALIAGDVLFANEVIEAARKEIIDKGITATSVIAESFRKAYQNVRMQRLVRNELESRGLDINSYYQTQQHLFPPLVQLIDNAFKQYNPRVEFIVAGQDGESCQLFTVFSPGDSICHDAIGYATIGSGAPHAIYSLIESTYKKSLNKESVEKFVKAAKKRSEVAPGVGKETKVVII